jgi:hypothetical protein
MVYDAKDHYTVLFGGFSQTGYQTITWKFVGGQWSKLVTTKTPAPRAYASMTYDSADGVVLLFGGCHSAAPCTTGYFLADTWEFSAGAWTKITATVHPSARAGSMMAYDSANRYVALFGGCNATSCVSPFADTWTFVGGAWTHLKPSPHPSARELGMATYDAKTGYVVLFGGLNSSFTPLNDTWKFVGVSWTKI